MEQVTLHPVVSLFPPLTVVQRDRLKVSIQERGCQIPVVFWNGKVIDGRHRVEICNELGVEYPKRELQCSEDEAIRLAWTLNDDRRHMTANERALAGAALTKLFEEAAKARERTGTLAPNGARVGKSASQAAALVGSTTRAVERAKTIQEKGTPELQQAVAENNVSLSKAASIAKQPAEVQKKVVDKAKQKKAKKEEETHFVDDEGSVIPPSLEAVFAVAPAYKRAWNLLLKAANALNEVEASPGYQRMEQTQEVSARRLYSTFCRSAAKLMADWRPAKVCEGCGGDGCAACGDKGWLTTEEAAE